MNNLQFDQLPNLPQTVLLRDVVSRLWANTQVVAIWLGGSLATDQGDELSDIDLRVAVPSSALADWKTPRFREIFGSEPLAWKLQNFGADALLHHLLVNNGDIYDLFVQSTGHDHVEAAITILGCRDQDFHKRLVNFQKPHSPDESPADARFMSDLIQNFWINSHKHRRVLRRGLDLVAMTGIYLERQNLLRLWYAAITGMDSGEHRPTIHSLTRMCRTVQTQLGPRALAIVGADLSTRNAILSAIDRDHEEASRAGRQLALKLGFTYPEALEELVRTSWARFKNESRD